MKNNSGQPSTPAALLSGRLRLNSYNSPFISPLRLVQSPFLQQSNIMDGNQSHADFHHFQLEENPQAAPLEQNVDEDEHQSESLPPPQQMVAHEHDDDIILDENNMLEFILANAHNPDKIQQAKAALQGYGSNFLKNLYEYLVSKFSKLKKTKEEMVKYCVRKSFKHITNKMRSANKEAYINMENNEVVAEYFQLHNEGDTSISMPFKKNSIEKTMNTNFQKKIFQCRQYNYDYKEFLRQFPAEYTADNRKKIKSMNEAIKKCVRTKSFKGLDQYKRYPWTQAILNQIYDFAKGLMDHSPYKKGLWKEREEKNQFEQGNFEKKQLHESEHANDEFEIIKKQQSMKRSVIIVTPPIKPMKEPESPPDDELL